MTLRDRIPDRAAIEFDLDHVAARRFHRFLDGDRHFTRFAATETDATLAVADHGQRGETEDPSALDDFGDTVDLDQLLEQSFFLHFLRIRHGLPVSPEPKIPGRPRGRLRPAP